MGKRALMNKSLYRDQVSMQLAIANGVQDINLAEKLRNKSWEELLNMSTSDSSILRDFEIPGEVLSEKERVLFQTVEDFIDEEKWSDALKTCEDILKINPKSKLAWIGTGYLKNYHLGRYEEAELAYLKAIETDGQYASVWNYLGCLYQDHLGRYEEAERAYLQAIKADGQYMYSWNNLGNLYQDHLGRYEDAERAYLQAMEIDGRNVNLKLNFIFFYRDRLNRIDEAKSIFKEMEEPDIATDSYWLNASLFDFYDANLGLAKINLLKGLKATGGSLPTDTQDDWWRFASVSIRLGYGQAILEVLKENGYDVILRPYYLAIQSLMEKNSEAFLNSIAVEVREVAADLAERIKRFI